MNQPHPQTPAAPPTSLREIVWLFVRLGTTAFGGPAAHIAMMEHEVVRRRGWLSRAEFLDYVAATNLIPGPNSTELAIHIGYARAGWPGLIAAGLSFIIPASLIVTAAAWSYVTYGSLPEVAGILYGVKPVVIGVVITALWALGRTAVKSPALAVLGVAAVVLFASGVHELLLLAGAALTMGLASRASALRWRNTPRVWLAGLAAASPGVAHAAVQGASGAGFAMSTLFLVFLKAGSVLFGSGYVLLAFLRSDFVERLGWLTEAQLIDAVAVGQVTPGPVFTTATFIGYVLGGGVGAVVATLGIFLPAFVFVALSGPLVPRIRRSPTAGAALDGVNVASLALMAVVCWQLGEESLIDPLTVALAVASLLALLVWRVNSALLVVVGGMFGFAATLWL